jgi:hypothetical protein
MTTTDPQARMDRLYRLLPAIYRMRDAEQKYPLQALLRVIASQVNVVEDDIDQLYRDWFIETSDDWAVPYIGDLIGYRQVLPAGEAGKSETREGSLLRRVLVPRREVANTIRYRRRRGTLAVLEQLAADVADWPAHPVEFFKLVGWNQNVDHLHLDRARTVDVRRLDSLDRLDGPFDSIAHSVDVRRINSGRSIGRYNIPSVGVFVWRLRSYSVTGTPAYCVEDVAPQCYTFSVLGQDAPLFVHPAKDADGNRVAGELGLPGRIRRFDFDRHPASYYGLLESLAIWADGWGGFDPSRPLPIAAIIPADLSSWTYVPPAKHVAVDPVLGRMAFPPSQLPRKGVRVSYHYGFSADMGGGEYTRVIRNPSPRSVIGPPSDAPGFALYQVGQGRPFRRIGDALQQWRTDAPADAVIELMESAVFVEPINIVLAERQTLQLRAANRTRPVIRVLDWQTDLSDALSVTMGRGSRFTIDGVLVTGRPMRVTGPSSTEDTALDASAAPERSEPDGNDPAGHEPDDSALPPPEGNICGAEVVIRHCTFVPGWGIDCDCEPKRPAEPSIELSNLRARVRIHASIVGAIQVLEDEVSLDPIPLCIADSIVDATGPERIAIGSSETGVAHAVLSIERTTVFGVVEVHAVELANNCIFNDCLNVARRQIGCMRYCYVPPGCRTPRRYHCQPDVVDQIVRDRLPAGDERDAAIANEEVRVRPQFTARRYGKPSYGQLGRDGADEIYRGADDESQMGAFHDLFEPQRAANLQARLDEFTPAAMDAGIVFVT